MTNIGPALLSIMMIASFALAAGGLFTLLRKGETKRGALMLVAAAVVLANVLIWTI